MANDSPFGSQQILNEPPPPYATTKPETYYDHLFEQYKLYVEKTHDYWDQFLATNEFFLKGV